MHSTKILEKMSKQARGKNQNMLGDKTDQSTDNDHPLTDNPSAGENYPLKNQVEVHEKILRSLMKNLGS